MRWRNGAFQQNQQGDCSDYGGHCSIPGSDTFHLFPTGALTTWQRGSVNNYRVLLLHTFCTKYKYIYSISTQYFIGHKKLQLNFWIYWLWYNLNTLVVYFFYEGRCTRDWTIENTLYLVWRKHLPLPFYLSVFIKACFVMVLTVYSKRLSFLCHFHVQWAFVI